MCKWVRAQARFWTPKYLLVQLSRRTASISTYIPRKTFESVSQSAKYRKTMCCNVTISEDCNSTLQQQITKNMRFWLIMSWRWEPILKLPKETCQFCPQGPAGGWSSSPSSGLACAWSSSRSTTTTMKAANSTTFSTPASFSSKKWSPSLRPGTRPVSCPPYKPIWRSWWSTGVQSDPTKKYLQI